MSQLEAALYIIITIVFLHNLWNLFKEASKLRKNGKTPLVVQNVITTIMAAIGEGLVVWGIYTLYEHYNVLESGYTASLVVFTLAFLLRVIGSRVMILLTWSIYIKAGKKKALKDIEEEQKGI